MERSMTIGYRRAGLALMILAILAVGGGCQRGGKPGGGFAPPPMPVEAAAVARRPVVDRFEAVGSIEAGEAITVVAEIQGILTSLPFREGEFVEAGSPIAQLDDAQAKAEVVRAEAFRDQQQVTYDRVKRIVEQNAGAPQDLDNAAANLKMAEADLALARTRFEKTRIVAPWSGLIGARRVSTGAFLRPGDPITDLSAIQEIKVAFSVPERYLAELKRGARVTVTTPAYPGVELAGVIDVVDPVLDAALRSAKILARVKNPGGRFRPGMSANVTAVLSERADALTIPSEAVFAEGDQNFAFVIKPDSTVTRAALELGTRLPDQVEVVKGLDPGMQVVRAGHQKLFEGAKVIPITSQPGPGGEAPAPPAAAEKS